ncbi:MAG: helicase-exonuclease AddAB subunit AddA [Oscillospiraceae bacterium]|jgi:ATP-dependent helicase/nuclease subunit A|nr:helicase-exonuclease AddAB subunit AddA [Oscillospiraceae bacterium]
MSVQWTAEQLQAIESRGGSLLVSAAAGSGKTAVLVERVLRLLCDAENPCGADELLIVTFTRLAAGEMRERIHRALGARLRENPNDMRLLRQQQLLPLARICTIDSFCVHLVKEHFSVLGIPPEIRLLDEGERCLWQEECIRDALEEAYKDDAPAFRALELLLESGGENRRLSSCIRRAGELALATPSPTDWLRDLCAPYCAANAVQDPWRKVILDLAAQRLSYWERMTAAALRLLEQDDALLPVMSPALQSDARFFARLRGLAEAGDWDALRAAIQKPDFVRMGAKRGYRSETGEDCKARRSRWKDDTKALAKQFCISTEEHRQDLHALQPLVEMFAALTGDYLDRYTRRKREKNAADFSDYTHWALQLLVDGKDQKTQLAVEIGKRFREILVDEYQDVNAAQGRLFEALSWGDENLFFVGDVKQSIYRFRQASPELFLNKRRSYARYDGRRYPACLVLGRNFRSRFGVTEAVNFAFAQLMQRESAELDYTAEEALVCGRDDAGHADTADTALHLLAIPEDANAAESLALEAAHIAGWIAEALRRGDTIEDKGAPRPLRPRDFCILLRSDRQAGIVFVEALRKAGVAAHSARTQSIFARREIQILLALLRVIDNPLQDVPLLALLLSPVFGFTAAWLARLRAAHPKEPALWQCLCAGAAEDPACAAFLDTVRGYRQFAAIAAPGDLIRWLLEETGLRSIVAALPQGGGRRANLHRLEEYALAFSDATGAGLSAFLRYMAQIESGDSLTSVNEVSESADVVRVMSIHKSKGLEFPVCIVAQCGHKFNTAELTDPLLLQARMGVGLQRPDAENRRRLPTLPHVALQQTLLFSSKSEELRLLYVAMTRARERLVLLCAEKKPEVKLRQLSARLSLQGTVMEAQAVRSGGSYADWLLSAALRHPDAHLLREAAGVPHSAALPCAARWHFEQFACGRGEGSGQTDACPARAAASPALLAEIRARLEYQYPFTPLTLLPAKSAVSDLTEREVNERYAFSAKPAFLQKGSATAAQKGTAMHAFLQYADYAAARADVQAEARRLLARGYLTQRQLDALEWGKLKAFFEGAFAQRMLVSPKILREQKFTLRISASELPGHEEIPADCLTEAETVVQGIIDCAFEEDGALVLLDYKTDRVDTPATLRERYGGQLAMYRRAMEECFGYEVREVLVYSFWLDETVEIGISARSFRQFPGVEAANCGK